MKALFTVLNSTVSPSCSRASGLGSQFSPRNRGSGEMPRCRMWNTGSFASRKAESSAAIWSTAPGLLRRAPWPPNTSNAFCTSTTTRTGRQEGVIIAGGPGALPAPEPGTVAVRLG